MKRYVYGVLAIVALYASAASAQSQCAVVCDKQWESASKKCPSGDSGRECKSVSAEQHEACLNSCNRQPQADSFNKQGAAKKTSLQGTR
jgi:hypothetical protein